MARLLAGFGGEGSAMDNNFVVTTDEGRIVGRLIDWPTANKIAQETNDNFYLEPDKCIRYERNIMDESTRVFVWLKNYANGDNYFVELK